LSLRELFSDTLTQWTVAAAVATTVFCVLWMLRWRLRRLSVTVAATRVVTELARGTRLPFLLVTSLLAGAHVLELPETAEEVLHSMVVVVLLLQAGLWGGIALEQWLRHRRADLLQSDRQTATTLNVVGFVGRVAIWAVVLLMALDNLGVNITALVAGLGVGGIAVALAVQSVLGDLLASVAIALDKPFAVGDFLVLADHMGTVEQVGIKSTKLRSLSGEQLVISNADLLSSRVRNYGRMAERRVVFSFRVTYETPPERLAAIPELVAGIVRDQPDTRFDRCHLMQFGPSSLDFECVYYVLSRDYNEYMDVQQQIILGIIRTLGGIGVEFAYPTQKLYVHSAAEAGAG